MIGVSKTFGGSSILSSPALRKAGMLVKSGVPVFFVFQKKQKEQASLRKRENIKGKKVLLQFALEKRIIAVESIKNVL